MPYRTKRACAEHGCPETVDGRSSRCPNHERKRHRRIDGRRGSSSQRGYGSKWQRVIRPAALRREPLCRFCSERGLATPATEVDHIDGNSRNNSPSNLRALCKPCHSRRTMRDQVNGARR